MFVLRWTDSRLRAREAERPLINTRRMQLKPLPFGEIMVRDKIKQTKPRSSGAHTRMPIVHGSFTKSGCPECVESRTEDPKGAGNVFARCDTVLT